MVAISSTASAANRLLTSLARTERSRIVDSCDVVPMKFGETLQAADRPIEHAYFPTEGYISLITPNGGAESVEVGLIGPEGVLGATLLLDVAVSPLQGLVQGAGSALRIRAKELKKLLGKSPGLSKKLNAYLFVLMAQIAQTAACNRFHRIEARLARWILMTQDRAHQTEFKITHDFLAKMLGVRRAGVTEAAGALQAKKLIRYRRGVMQVLNRRALEIAACPCYRIFNSAYERHLGA
jgi:CRP-like cAMP-binding protein